MANRGRAGYGLLALALAAGCGDRITAPAGEGPQFSAVKFWEVGSSVAWNHTARELLGVRGSTPFSQVRILTYLSLAQYNAVLAAEGAKERGEHASPAAAAAGASVVVLKTFFPLDAALLENRIAAQRTSPPWPGEQQKDFAAGETIGRAIGAQVNAYAAGDHVGQTPAPANPGGTGHWTGVNPVLGLYGIKPFALNSANQFQPGPPPAFGSPSYLAALAEVKTITDGLTPAQLAIAQFWAANGGAYLNSVAAELIVSHHKSEREAARTFALANIAGFDVLIACWDAKFYYYFIRPTQADPSIKLAVALPNHPSYPSGHSCNTAGYAAVLESIFPDATERLEAIVEEAGIARIYGGLHYRFDLDAGHELGRRVGEWVLQVMGLGNKPIALD